LPAVTNTAKSQWAPEFEKLAEKNTAGQATVSANIKRKRIEECFGWLKTIASLRKVRHRGIFTMDWMFAFACAGYNLVRLRNLSVQSP